MLVVTSVAAILCFCRLGSRAMWQDEGETAVLGRSVLEHGAALAKNGENLVLQDAVAFDQHYRWTFHPWGQFYLAAAAFALFGQSDLTARLPFAACGVATVALLYCFVWRHWRCGKTAALCALLLALSATFVIHARQCRYYGADALACLCVIGAFVEVVQRPSRRWGMFLGFALALQFYVNFGTLWAILPGLAIVALLMGASRRAWLHLFVVGCLALILALPGLIFHRQRLLGGGGRAGELDWQAKSIAHLSYLDGWFVPLVVLLCAGLALSAKAAWKREAISKEMRIAVGLALLMILGAIVIAYSAPIPHVRYLIAVMPVAKLTLGVAVMGMFKAIETLARSRRPAVGITGACIVILVTTNFAALPVQLIADLPDQRTPDFCTATAPYLRFDFAGLLYELAHDVVDPDRIRRGAASDLARSGDLVLTNYGDLPLLFHRPDLVIRGGVGGGVRPVEAGRMPDVVLIQTRYGRVFGEYLQTLTRSDEYESISLRIPDTVYGNIAEPRAHMFATPNTTDDFHVLIRKDHAERLKKLPNGTAELLRRWGSRENASLEAQAHRL